jgi:hypothetical protein
MRLEGGEMHFATDEPDLSVRMAPALGRRLWLPALGGGPRYAGGRHRGRAALTTAKRIGG